jgi:hypothetical protein
MTQSDAEIVISDSAIPASFSDADDAALRHFGFDTRNARMARNRLLCHSASLRHCPASLPAALALYFRHRKYICRTP